LRARLRSSHAFGNASKAKGSRAYCEIGGAGDPAAATGGWDGRAGADVSVAFTIAGFSAGMGAGTSAAAGSAATGELGIADLSGAGASIRDTGVSPPLPAFGITILAASDLLSLEGLTSEGLTSEGLT
jgi:hypothetical protein